MIIYRITNAKNGRQYIGRTVESARKRLLRHCAEAVRQTHHRIALYNAIRKYGVDVCSIEVIEVCSTVEEMLQAESRHIRAASASGIHLYNMTLGGDGSLGLAHSIDSRRKIREAALSRDLRMTSPRCKPCVVGGVSYHSVTHAARCLGTNRTVVQRWLRTNTFRTKAKRSDCRGFKEPFNTRLIAT